MARREIAAWTLLGAVALGVPASADAAKPRVRLSEKKAVPGQVVVATAAKLKKARVSVVSKKSGAKKKARVLSRSKKRIKFQVPGVKPGGYRVDFRTAKYTRSAPLRVRRGFSGKLSIELESSKAANADIGSAGGKVTATGSNGTRYELTVPAGALATSTIVTLTPIAKLTGLPSGKSTKNAVHFAPEGLQFAKPAELRITPVLGDPVALTASGTGRDVVFERGGKDGSSSVVQIAHFSLGATFNMTLQDFENLLASWATQPMTLRLAAQFFDMLPDFNHTGFCDSSPTCQTVRTAARTFVGDFALHPDSGACADEARRAFVYELEATVDLIFSMEADLATLGEPPRPGFATCRRKLVEAMYKLIHDTAPTDPLGGSGACSHMQIDLDGNGSVQEIECAVRVAANAESQGFGDLRDLAIADVKAGLRKILDDGKKLCEEQHKTNDGSRLLIRGAQYAQGLNDSGALGGLDVEFDDAIRECEPKITITPSNPSVEVGKTKDFTATSEDPEEGSITWSAETGTINQAGHFTAPTEPGPVVVRATSTKEAWFPTSESAFRFGKTTVDVTCPAGKFPFTLSNGSRECRTISIDISPTSATLNPGGTKQFSATVDDADDKRVDWSTTGGTITQPSGTSLGGLYTAPNAPGSYTVTAASHEDPTKQATATVTVGSDPAVEVTGRTAQLYAGGVNSSETVDRESTLPFSGLFVDAASSDLADAAQNSDVEPSADGHGWLDFDGSIDGATSADGDGNGHSLQEVFFKVVDGDGTATLSCTGNWSASGGAAQVEILLRPGPGAGEVLSSGANGGGSINFSRELTGGSFGRSLYMLAETGYAGSASMNVTCDVDGAVAVAPNP